MVRGKAFMPPPWSNAFDTVGQIPPPSTPGSTNPKEEHSKRRVKRGTKRDTEVIWSFFIFLFGGLVFVLLRGCVCVQSHPTCYDHTPCDVLGACVFSSLLPERWSVKSGLSLSLGLVSTDSSSVCHHLSLPWNLRRSITLPVTDLAITHFTPAAPSPPALLLVLVTPPVFLSACLCPFFFSRPLILSLFRRETVLCN